MKTIIDRENLISVLIFNFANSQQILSDNYLRGSYCRLCLTYFSNFGCYIKSYNRSPEKKQQTQSDSNTWFIKKKNINWLKCYRPYSMIVSQLYFSNYCKFRIFACIYYCGFRRLHKKGRIIIVISVNPNANNDLKI